MLLTRYYYVLIWKCLSNKICCSAVILSDLSGIQNANGFTPAIYLRPLPSAEARASVTCIQYPPRSVKCQGTSLCRGKSDSPAKCQVEYKCSPIDIMLPRYEFFTYVSSLFFWCFCSFFGFLIRTEKKWEWNTTSHVVPFKFQHTTLRKMEMGVLTWHYRSEII